MPRDGDADRRETGGFAWSESKRIFIEALELDRDQRLEYVAHACGAGSDLYREVVSLLDNYNCTDFLEHPPAEAIVPLVDPFVGKRVGVYQILRQIGRGGMGAVYMAERADDQFRKCVALKTLRPELVSDPALRRFQNERQTLAVLDHPDRKSVV